MKDNEKELLTLSGRDAGHDNESWVFTAPIGRPFYDGYRVRDISLELAQTFLTNFRKANAHFESVAPEGKSVYRFPINTEHKGDGKRRGDIVDAKISGEGDEYGIYTKAKWLNKTWEEIQAGSAQHVSIETKPSYTLEDGTELGPTLTAFAVTNQPRIVSQGTIQDTLELTLSRINLSNIEDSEMDELKELLASILANQDEIKASLKAAKADEDEEDIEANQDEDEDMPGDPDVIQDTVDGVKEIADKVAEIQGSSADETKFDPEAFKTEILTLTRKTVQESVTEVINASPDTRLNLSETGSESAPATSKPDFQTRKEQLIKSGMTRDQAMQQLINEGYRS